MIVPMGDQRPIGKYEYITTAISEYCNIAEAWKDNLKTLFMHLMENPKKTRMYSLTKIYDNTKSWKEMNITIQDLKVEIV